MVDEPIAFVRADGRPSARNEIWGGFSGPARRGPEVRFERRELDQILSVYGRMVAAGEWRDYAIDFTPDAAVFSAFRRTSEVPLYRIEKRPALRTRQGQFAVIGAAGQILKRGHDLRTVLRYFDRKLLKAVRD